MEWSTTSNVENTRVTFVAPPWLEPNSSTSLYSFNYDPYAGNSYTPVATQTRPVISIPESENIMNEVHWPSNKEEMSKKKMRRLTNEQLASLEQSFQEDVKLDSERKVKLSSELGLQPRQIAVWFQNRRARWKAKHLEEAYDSLRKEYDAVCRENKMLHNEVNRLRGMILKDHLTKRQSNLHGNQIAGGSQVFGIDQYNNPMLATASASASSTYPW